MARLRWEDVRAPQLDTRGFSDASQAMTGAFDRLGQALVQRQTNKDEELLAGARTQALLATDEAGVRAAIEGGMAGLRNDRQRAALAGEMGAIIGQTQENRLRQDQIMDSDGINQFGAEAFALRQAAWAGDESAFQALQSQFGNDPTFNRWMSRQADGLQKASEGGHTFRQTGDRDAATDARGRVANSIQSRSVALREREYAQQQADRRALEEAQASGIRDSQRDTAESAESVRILATREARDRGLKGPAFGKYVDSRVDSYLANQLTVDEQAAIGGIGELRSGADMFSAQLDTLQAAGQNIFEQEHRDLAVLQRAGELGNKTYDEGFAAYERAADTFINPPGLSNRRAYEELIASGTTPAMVVAHAELYGNKDASFWDTSRGLQDTFRQISDLNSRGGTVLAAETLARINQPVEAVRQQLERALRNAELAAQAAPDRKVPAAAAAAVADLQKRHQAVMKQQEEVLESLRLERDKDAPRTKLDRDRQAAALEEERRAAASSRGAGR